MSTLSDDPFLKTVSALRDMKAVYMASNTREARRGAELLTNTIAELENMRAALKSGGHVEGDTLEREFMEWTISREYGGEYRIRCKKNLWYVRSPVLADAYKSAWYYFRLYHSAGEYSTQRGQDDERI